MQCCSSYVYLEAVHDHIPVPAAVVDIVLASLGTAAGPEASAVHNLVQERDLLIGDLPLAQKLGRLAEAAAAAAATAGGGGGGSLLLQSTAAAAAAIVVCFGFIVYVRIRFLHCCCCCCCSPHASFVDGLRAVLDNLVKYT